MDQFEVKIVRFVDDAFPGWVACEFEDADGHRHTLIDKVPIFTGLMLNATSTYSQVGIARCEILGRWKDAQAREFVRVSTAKPDGIESTQGLSEFVVFSSEVSTVS